MDPLPKKDDSLSMLDAYSEHKSVLMAYMSKFILKPEDVEDILQETFLRSLEADHTKVIKSPRSYLFIVARNLIYRTLKRKSRDAMKDIDDIDEEYLISNEVPVDVSLHQKRKMKAFLVATDGLPAQCRRVFLMRKLMGMSQLEIAQKLDISKSTVERHITNAITRCQATMAKDGYNVGSRKVVESLVSAKSVMNDD